MKDYLFILLIGALGLLSTFITSKGSLYDRRFRDVKYIKKRGWIVAGLGIIIVILSIWQYKAAQESEIMNENARKQEQIIRDSVISYEINKGVEENRKKLFEDLSIALAKQGLILDTVNQQIEKFVSNPPVVIDFLAERPLISLSYKSISHKILGDSVQFKIIVSSEQAGSNILIGKYLCKIIFKDGSSGYTRIGILFANKMEIPKGGAAFNFFKIPNLKPISEVQLFIEIKYNDLSDKASYNLERAFIYNLESGITLFLDDKNQDELRRRYKN